jgi:pimeloyl-ACP methyl ester carboxylesterase
VRHLLHHDVFVRAAGREDGPRTVLWIHGLGESGLSFEGVLDHPELAGWRHLAPDLPGYGRTAWPREPQPLGEVADLLADLAAELAGGPVVLAGHSLGGVLALLVAERHRSLVLGVVDIDGNKSPEDCTFSGQTAREDLAAFTGGGFDALRDRVYRAGVDDPAQRGYHASLRLASPAQFWHHGRELVALSARRDLASRLAALAGQGLPVAYVAGAPGGASGESRRLLAEARVPVVEIAPSGHWPFLDQPDAFTAALARFLSEVD